jgi:hypothetical protein
LRAALAGRLAAVRVAVGVLVAVELGLEVVVAGGDQGQHAVQVAAGRRQPAMRVVASQGPQHHVEALLDHRALWRQQHRHRALGRCGKHLGRLVPQRDLAQLATLCAGQQGEAGAHGVGAAAKRIENGQGGGHSGGGSRAKPPIFRDDGALAGSQALAGDAKVMEESAEVLRVGDLALAYRFTDVDGRQVPMLEIWDARRSGVLGRTKSPPTWEKHVLAVRRA